MAEYKVEDDISTSGSDIKVSLDDLQEIDQNISQKALQPLIQANNYLALNLLKELCKGDGNIFFSPFSLSLSFAMLYSGAQGKSACEIRNVFGYNIANISDSEVHKCFKMILMRFSDKNDACVLTLANAVLSQINFPFLPAYQEGVQHNYGALLKSVDFLKSSKQAVLEINEWVKEKTRNKIQSIFDDLDPNTVMVILNAIYFKGVWRYQFDPRHTRPGLFYNRELNSDAKEVPMMYIKKRFSFEEREDFKILVLPYEGDNMSMILLLPKRENGIKNLEEFFVSCSVDSLFENLQDIKVKVTLPKLHFEYKENLESIFQALGLESLFSPEEANLHGLSNCDGLFVSQVVHKAVIDVTEEGSEAAAVTGIGISGRMMPLLDPEFKADHPFLFLIVDKNKMVLFMGRVLEL